MQVAESERKQDAASQSGLRPRRRWSIRRTLWICLGVGATAAILIVAGFLWFLAQVPDRQVVLNRNADAIVVLTGGSSRVMDGIELLAAGRGQRLLITGVHRATNTSEISRVAPEHEPMLRCCVDLDRSALNTLGNAVGTRRWVKERGFRSLIVVTSGYHMPRAIAELSHQLPDVMLIPFPVLSQHLRAEPWWARASTVKLLFSEYLKYTFALVRMRLYPLAGDHSGA